MTSDPPGRLLAVGDIHGQNTKLSALLERVAPTDRDQVVFLGDYIDRGPDSYAVIEFLLQFCKQFPRTILLRGNHECMLQDFLNLQRRQLYLMNGGQATIESYRRHQQPFLPPVHQSFLNGLTPYYETEKFIFVHAGLRPGVPLLGQTEQDLYWIREEFLGNDYSWGKTIVFGHTPQPEPLVEAERLGLDTGAAYGRGLTCCDVNRRTFWVI